jgi:hypothetical protein
LARACTNVDPPAGSVKAGQAATTGGMLLLLQIVCDLLTVFVLSQLDSCRMTEGNNVCGYIQVPYVVDWF